MKADQYPQNRTNEHTLHVAQIEREREWKSKIFRASVHLISTELHYEEGESQEYMNGNKGAVQIGISKMYQKYAVFLKIQ